MADTTDLIDYTPAFREFVKGQLMARFRLDPERNPLFEQDGRLRHYTIDLLLDSPNAAEIQEVKYLMDDPSYEGDAEGSTDDSVNQFQMEISSYGNFQVIVTVTLGSKQIIQRAWLSNMLENGYRGEQSPEIRDAIRRIKAN